MPKDVSVLGFLLHVMVLAMSSLVTLSHPRFCDASSLVLPSSSVSSRALHFYE